MIAEASGRLAVGMTQAATVLRELLTSPAEAIRLRAACHLLELGMKAFEQQELQRRVEELEQHLSERGSP